MTKDRSAVNCLQDGQRERCDDSRGKAGKRERDLFQGLHASCGRSVESAAAVADAGSDGSDQDICGIG